MANYVSALNGEQMDAALTDVALHNSEAWAVGTRNTIPVSSSDETYHNNAKYYAQVAQSAIPGTYTAAVRWDIAQGLAGEAQEQARANISAGASNRNLLDNPWFSVNQRGFTTGITGSGLTVDRWRSDNANISLSNGVISIPANATFKQIIDTDLYNFLVGKTVTLSCMLSDGTIQSGTVIVPSTGSIYAPNTPRLALNGTNKQFHIYPPSAVSIKAFKLELGAYSTLANDVPPDYGEELRKCRFYYRRYANPLSSGIYIMTGMCLNSTTADFIDNEPMYGGNSGTCAYNGSILINGQALTGVTLYSRNDGKISQNNLRFTVASGLTANQVAGISCTGGSYIEISHDL